MDEEQTFNKLRRIPLEDMLVLLSNANLPPPLFTLGSRIYERSDFYNEMNFELEKIKMLKDNGWGIDDFYIELEKRSILKIVKEYNNSLIFPQELLDRITRSFPNAKFIPAKIELE